MSWIIIALFILVGIVLMILEILVLPGHIFFGLLGFAAFTFGIVETYLIYGYNAGNWVLFGSFVAALFAIIQSLRSKTWKRISLKSTLTGKVGEEIKSVKEGQIGTTIGRLAPMGKAMFHGSIVEVKSEQGFIDPDTKVIIRKIDGNRVLVHKVEEVDM